MHLARCFSKTFLLLALIFQAACSGPRSTREGATRIGGGPEDIFPADLIRPERFYITITPEMVRAAQASPDCHAAGEDPNGHWGPVWEGIQLSIRLQKEVFTNGEPVIACVTLRNVGFKQRYYGVLNMGEESDTKLTLKRGQERLLGSDDPKPWETFEQRLRHIRAGSGHVLPVMPGTQRQFVRDLSRVFDLTLPGAYSICAEREVSAFNELPNRPGYMKGSATNIVSGTATFQVVAAAAQ